MDRALAWLRGDDLVAERKALEITTTAEGIRSQPDRTRPITRLRGRALTGGRISFDKAGEWNHSAFTIEAPPDAENSWRLQQLDSRTLERLSPAELIELLADLSPDVSKALWDFLRLCNPGWEAKAYRPGRSKGTYKRAQDALDGFMEDLKNRHGSVDVLLNRLYAGAFLRGAFFVELVLDRAGRLPLDLATPDPHSARFRKQLDAQHPELGQVWALGQRQNAVWIDLSGYETIRYLPIDPYPGSPYGRSLVSPAIFSAIFLLAMLHDLRRVVQQQGYPRPDIEIDVEALKATMPDLEGDELNQWIESAIQSVVSYYSRLEPDDAYVHPSFIKFNRPVGTVDSSSLGAVDGLIRALERMITRGLKSIPLLMGSNEGTSETHANRQWEVHVAGIKAIQHLAESLLEHLLTLALQAQGIAARVEFRFSELRAAEMLRDAQVESLQIANAIAKRDQGWIDNDGASMEVTGHPAVADPRQVSIAPPTTPENDAAEQAKNTDADPGSDRAAPVTEGAVS